MKNLDKTGRKREQQRKRFYLSRLRLLESRIRKNEERERERKRASERERERERERDDIQKSPPEISSPRYESL